MIRLPILTQRIIQSPPGQLDGRDGAQQRIGSI